MKEIDWKKYGLETQAIRAGQRRSHEDEHSLTHFCDIQLCVQKRGRCCVAFYRTKARQYLFPLYQSYRKRFSGTPWLIWKVASAALAFASGMAAISGCWHGVCLKAGDHVVCSRGVFGNTTLLFQNYFGKFGVETDFVELIDTSAWEAAIKPNTRFLFLETPIQSTYRDCRY